MSLTVLLLPFQNPSLITLMKIILDTNVWLDFFDDRNLLDGLDSSLVTPTFLNYFELMKMKKIADSKYVYKFKWIFNKMDEFHNKIFDPSFVHLAKQNKFYHFNVLLELRGFFDFFKNYKEGVILSEEKAKEFINNIDLINQDFADFSQLLNNKAQEIKVKIKNTKSHINRDSIILVENYVSWFVNLATGQDISMMDFSKIEILIKVLDLYFKRLEIGTIISETNDIIDFLFLCYVQPGDFYVTKDKKWKRLIKDSGCERYLLTL